VYHVWQGHVDWGWSRRRTARREEVFEEAVVVVVDRGEGGCGGEGRGEVEASTGRFTAVEK
jgi:hypothetical protein